MPPDRWPEIISPEGLTLEAAYGWLTQYLGNEGKRLTHCLGVYEKTAELCQIFSIPEVETRKALFAALIHDVAKLWSSGTLIAFCEQPEHTQDLPIDTTDLLTPQTLHAFVGAALAKNELGLTDPDILNAMRYHTTARTGMTRVEKLLYIADKLEARTRNPAYIQAMSIDLNPCLPDSLERTMLHIIDATLTLLVSQHALIHPRTIDTRNELLKQLRTHDTVVLSDKKEDAC